MPDDLLWIITVVGSDDPEPSVHVFDDPRNADDMIDAILHTTGIVTVRSLHLECCRRGVVELVTPARRSAHRGSPPPADPES